MEGTMCALNPLAITMRALVLHVRPVLVVGAHGYVRGDVHTNRLKAISRSSRAA
jgi:hypothetical protein